MISTEKLLPLVAAIAQEAGAAILAIYLRNQYEIKQKQDQTPVTEADLRAHQIICQRLQQLTPQLPILSEESPASDVQNRQEWPCFWLVDPLDGTKEFIKHNDEFTVNIALIENGQTVLGAVYVPVTGTTYLGSPGGGAWKVDRQGNYQQIQCRRLKRSRALKVLISRSHYDARLDHYLKQLRAIAVVETQGVGSSLKLCLLAEGLADLHLRIGRTCEWDTAAAQAVLEAAGGGTTDLELQPLRYNQRPALYNPDFIAVADTTFDWQPYLRPG